MKFAIKNFSSKCDETRRELGTCSHLLEKSLMEHFVFSAVWVVFRTPSSWAKSVKSWKVFVNFDTIVDVSQVFEYAYSNV